MCLRFVFLLTTHVAAWLRLSRREKARKTAEILILRHQLTVLQRRHRRPRLNWADRALLAARPAHARTGRPVTRRNIQALVRRLARETPNGGTEGSRRAGQPRVKVAASTMWEILKASNIDP